MVQMFQTDDGSYRKALHARWRRRKNRPLGSQLRGVCGCAAPEDAPFCGVCKLEEWLAEKNFELGDLIFPSFAERKTEMPGRTVTKGKPGLVLKQLRKCLGWVPKTKAPNAYTLKTYSAGRATAMASAGFNLCEIQLAGEWSSTSAPFSYMNSDVADRAQELKFMVHKMYKEPVSEEEGDDI